MGCQNNNKKNILTLQHHVWLGLARPSLAVTTLLSVSLQHAAWKLYGGASFLLLKQRKRILTGSCDRLFSLVFHDLNKADHVRLKLHIFFKTILARHHI